MDTHPHRYRPLTVIRLILFFIKTHILFPLNIIDNAKKNGLDKKLMGSILSHLVIVFV